VLARRLERFFAEGAENRGLNLRIAEVGRARGTQSATAPGLPAPRRRVASRDGAIEVALSIRNAETERLADELARLAAVGLDVALICPAPCTNDNSDS